MRRLVYGLTWAFAAACAANDAASGDEAPDEPPAPPSIDLLVPELEVSAAELGEISLPVADLRADTRVVIDGQAWLPGGVAPAVFVDDELHVPLGGAMVVGVHELSLRHQAGSEVLESETVTITIVESEPAGLEANLVPTVVGMGDRLVAHGQGPDAAFGVIDQTTQRVLVRAGPWSADGFELELPGLDASEGLRVPVDLTISTVDDGPSGGPERWVVVAWLAAGGREVRARVAPIDGHGVPSAEPGESLSLWSLDDPEQVASLGPHEVVSIDGVALLDRMVVMAIDAQRDAEQVGVGDRLLVARLLAAVGTAGEPVLLRGLDSRDLDLPADARLWTAGPSTALSVRIGLGFSGMLELGSNGLPLLREDADETHAVPGASTWMASAEGAFGSRHVYALAENESAPQVHVLRLNRWSTPDPEQIVGEAIDLPAWPSSSPSVGIFDGVPTLVMPMGADRDAVALRSTGAAARLDTIDGLRCDELVLANPGTDGVADTLPFACLLAGQVRLGFISVD